jgi:hypothetical protein
VFLSKSQDGVHLTAHAGIVHGHHSARLCGDQALQLAFIHVERVWVDIGKNRYCTAQNKGVHGGNKGKGWKYDLVAGF